jgi:phosphatidylglycerophosphate synthase
MNLRAYLIGDSAVSLWALTPRERLRRQLKSLKISLTETLPDDAGNGNIAHDRVLLIRCDYLFELRTLKCLIDKDQFVLLDDNRQQVVAAILCPGDARRFTDLMERQFSDPLHPADLPAILSNAIPAGDRSELSVYDERLRRAEPPLLEKLEANKAGALEDQLYGNAYKGVTDLVTKWAWPRPAKYLVHVCARRGLSPNQVTSAGLLLVFLACFLFYQGFFFLGLLAGWIMTLLDTVDGKLARVRVQSSKFGNVYDHGIDLIHPPFWYLLWALGLDRLGYDIAIGMVATLIFVGYIAGRLAELAFEKLCGGSIFTWQPFDSWFRLVTARRNPCLIILTVGLMVYGPVTALWGVIWWTLATTAVLWIRVYQGLNARQVSTEKLPSWLENPNARELYPLSHPVFSRTKGAYTA